MVNKKSDGLVNGTAVKLPLKAIMEPCCFADSFFHSTGLMLLISDLLELSFMMDIRIAMTRISKKWIMLFILFVFGFGY